MKKKLSLAGIVAVLFFNSCFTDIDGAKKVLEHSGYKVITVGGYDYFNGDDTYKTKFKAVALNGDTVTGAVTHNYWGKGSTVRLDD